MVSGEQATPSSPLIRHDGDTSIDVVTRRHQLELKNLTLTMQPFKTLKFFTLATMQYLKKSTLYVLTKGGWFLLLATLALGLGSLIITVDGPHEKHVEEFFCYLRFVLWWVALGVASSIGLGSGLHTFVLYLGPHIALFTIKAMQCGRVDLKTAPYDTIQLKRVPSWLEKDCCEYGPPVFPFRLDSLVRVPLRSILPQVQLEAVLWGLGTALGELPPYFISRAARMAGAKVDAMEELDPSKKDDGVAPCRLLQIKLWFFSHRQHLNFFTILILASVPNPLFDLAGIMCGQFGIPFWKFFLATLIGKAVIKTHIQTVFIISVCNNQLLELMENKVIWVLGFIPGLSSILPGLISKLHKIKDKYMTPAPATTNTKGKQWDLSFALIWNTIVWLMLMNFFVKIVTDTAQKYLKKQQEEEVAALRSISQQLNGEFNSVSD